MCFVVSDVCCGLNIVKVNYFWKIYFSKELLEFSLEKN